MVLRERSFGCLPEGVSLVPRPLGRREFPCAARPHRPGDRRRGPRGRLPPVRRRAAQRPVPTQAARGSMVTRRGARPEAELLLFGPGVPQADDAALGAVPGPARVPRRRGGARGGVDAGAHAVADEQAEPAPRRRESADPGAVASLVARDVADDGAVAASARSAGRASSTTRSSPFRCSSICAATRPPDSSRGCGCCRRCRAPSTFV